jgi:outer membrane murein-binding lipoprotein Lpp
MAKDHERDLKELRSQLGQVEAYRDDLKRDLKDARADARAAKRLHAQAEKRLAALLLKAVKAARAEKSPSPARGARGRRRE